jgi:hypothetical protein
MTAPTFRGVALDEHDRIPSWYVGHIAGCRVECWQVVCHLGSLWFARADIGTALFELDGGRPTASLALRSLLTELTRVHRKLGKLLEPVNRKKAGRK